MVEVAVAEITVMKSLVTKLAAVGSPFVMIVECSTAMPVVAPVVPAPAISAEEADTKSNTKGKADAVPKNAGHGIPAGIRDDRPTVHEPRVVGGDINDLRVGRFDDDGAALRRNLLLFVAIQVASVLGLTTQRLDAIGDIVRLVHIGLAKR